MKYTRQILFILMLIVSGIGVFIIAASMLQVSSSGGGSESDLIGISRVEIEQNEFYVNEPPFFESGKIYLLTNQNESRVVDLKLSNIANLKTENVGNFEMTIIYDKFSYRLPYSVKYKTVKFAEDYVFEFELNQQVDFSQYKIEFYDYFDKVVKTSNFSDGEVVGVDTSSRVSQKKATVEIEDYVFEFDYSVDYFASHSNYVGSADLGDVEYCVTKFIPSTEGVLEIAKIIKSIGVIDAIYTFELMKIDGEESSLFLGESVVAEFFHNKTLTVFGNAIESGQNIEISLELGDVKNLPYAKIDKILKIENLEDEYILNQNFEGRSAIATLQLNNFKTVQVELSDFDIDTSKVGSFSVELSYFSHVFEFEYQVKYKKLEFYFKDHIDFDMVFQIGQTLDDFYIVCYDYFDRPVQIKGLEAEDVVITGFDTSKETENAHAVISYYGAILEFDYAVKSK